MKVKKFLNSVLQTTLEPIRNRRREYEKNIDYVYEVLRKGSEKAEETAANTLHEVKEAMKINYFDDKELILQQQKEFDEAAKEREALEARKARSRAAAKKA